MKLQTLSVWTTANMGMLASAALENKNAFLICLIASGLTMALALIELMAKK